MKRKELILLENRLRKLLKEDTIKGPDDTENVEVASGVKLPPVGPSGKNFDFVKTFDDKTTLSYNRKVRQPKETIGSNYDKWTASTYGGVVRYKNPDNVVMYFYAKQDPDDPQIPDQTGLMGNTSARDLDNNFKSQKQWNDFVRRIEEKKKNSLSPKIFNSKTKEIQDYIINNFPQYKDLLGTKKPNDGLWGLKTDEAILRIIYDIKNSQSQKTETDSKISSGTEPETETGTEVSTGDKNADSKVKSNVDKFQNQNKETPKDETPKDETLKGSEETPQVQYGLGNW